MLFLVYLVFPIIEIYLLFKASSSLGFFPVLGTVIFTAWIGARLVKSQGLVVLSQFQQKMIQGHLPQKEGLEGLLVLLAGVLLISPGFITDFIGVLCLIPFTRKFMSVLLAKWIERKVRQGRLKVYSNVSYSSSNASPFGTAFDPFASKSKPEIRDVNPSTNPENPQQLDGH